MWVTQRKLPYEDLIVHYADNRPEETGRLGLEASETSGKATREVDVVAKRDGRSPSAPSTSGEITIDRIASGVYVCESTRVP